MTPSRAGVIFKTDHVGPGGHVAAPQAPVVVFGVIAGSSTAWLGPQLVPHLPHLPGLPTAPAARSRRSLQQWLPSAVSSARGPGGGVLGVLVIRPVTPSWGLGGCPRLTASSTALHGRVRASVTSSWRLIVVPPVLYGRPLPVTGWQSSPPDGLKPGQDKGLPDPNVQLRSAAVTGRQLSWTASSRWPGYAGVDHTLGVRRPVAGSSTPTRPPGPSMYVILKASTSGDGRGPDRGRDRSPSAGSAPGQSPGAGGDDVRRPARSRGGE